MFPSHSTEQADKGTDAKPISLSADNESMEEQSSAGWRKVESEPRLSEDDLIVLEGLPNTVSLLLASRFPAECGWELLKVGVTKGWWGWGLLAGCASWVARLLRWAGERKEKR